MATSAGRAKHRLPPVPTKKPHVIIATDYGTTFTSVSYYVDRKGIGTDTRLLNWDDVKTVRNWPGDPSTGGLAEQVPTMTWYPSVLHKQRAHVPDQFDGPSEPLSEEQTSSTRGSRVPVIDKDDSDDDHMNVDQVDDDDSTEFLWGYQVPYQMYKSDTRRDPQRRIDRAKLMLVDTAYTERERRSVRAQLNFLIKQGLIRKFGKRKSADIRDIRDVITDFLVPVFQHTRDQLQKFEKFDDTWSVEFVFTVPIMWSPESSRVLQTAMASAIQESSFGSANSQTVDDLFFIYEPEAAGLYFFGTSGASLAGETIPILDCGGGTVDAITYTLAHGYPVRLGKQVVDAGGDNCGGSYLNENYKSLLMDRLRHAKYLERNVDTISNIVNDLIPDFEEVHKRKDDVTKKVKGRIRIRGLRANQKARFDDNSLLLNENDYKKIYFGPLQRVEKVARQQLEACFKKHTFVKRVLLIGGFGAAPSLRSWLQNFLTAFSEEKNLPYTIKLIQDPQKSVTAVSAGAVIAAVDKSHGPTRITQSSYGFLRQEPFEPSVWPAHKGKEPRIDSLDGGEYLDVINYFVIKGDVVPTYFEYPPLVCYHIFEVDCEKFLCEELLYVSDIATKSHYTLTHPQNRRCQMVGSIVTDFTFVKDLPGFKPIKAEPDLDGGISGSSYYKIEYSLVPIIQGRSLKYKAVHKYLNGRETEASGGKVSIAAAFKPGTE